jgi:hypothetical protein
MYKGSSDKLTYIERVASHATKEHPSGRIDAIPTNAEQPVEYFNALCDQYKILAENYKSLMADATMLRARLKLRLSHDEYHRVQGQYDVVGGQMHSIQQQFSELRPMIRAARGEATDAFMWFMAKSILQQEDVWQIENQCARFAAEHLYVPPGLRAKSVGERDGDSHKSKAKANKRNLRRRHSHENFDKAKREGLVMYDTSDFKQDKAQRYTLSLPIEDAKKRLAAHFNKRGK